ncbi:hypothetical protein BGZ65_010897, partial [Modicella reniformis]
MPKKLTRRQKLKQLRKLFMHIRNEIGDGGGAPQPPPSSVSRPVDQRNDTSGSFNSATEEDDDSISGSPIKTESFSDDPSFQYRPPMANSTAPPFPNRRGSTMAKLPSSAMRGQEHEFELGFARSSAASMHYPDESFTASPGVRSQHQRQRQQKLPQCHGQGLTTSSSNGRKSPFEWAAAAASSAAASIGGFGHSSSHGSTTGIKQSSSGEPSNRQKPHYNSSSGSNHY